MRKILALLVILAVCGCVKLPGQKTDDVVCNPPYMRFQQDCCLDQNNNMVCDIDEATTTSRPQTTYSPTTQPPLTTLSPTSSTQQTTSTTQSTTSITSQTTSISSTTTTTLELNCTETDSGLDEYVKGTATRGLQHSTDVCRGTAALTEYYCSNNRIAFNLVQCELGCEDGRCLGCLDTDGGDNPATYGVVTIGKTLEKPDYCSKQGDGNILREYFCLNPKELGYRDVECEVVCDGGRCED